MLADLAALRGRLRRHLRGARHAARAARAPARALVEDGASCWRYGGLDGVVRRTRGRLLAGAASRIEPGAAGFELTLPGRGERPSTGDRLRAATRAPRPPGLRRRRSSGLPRTRRAGATAARVSTLERAVQRLDRRAASPTCEMMTTRDGRRAVSRTPACPGSARSSAATGSSPRCRCCGSTRARARRARLPGRHAGRPSSTRQDAEPGKILHEMRHGEMAALGEIPFGRYYGSVDATPLFVMLAGAYYHRTGDLDASSALWPHVERALAWIDDYGDPDGDGFVEYAAAAPTRPGPPGLEGLATTRSSTPTGAGRGAHRAVRGAGLRLRRAAGRRGSPRALGSTAVPASCWPQAESLRSAFEEAFWCEELGTYALALDGDKQPCRVRDLERRPLPVPASPARARRSASPRRCWRRDRSPAGACAPWRRASRATTRCRTTTARSGRTTTPHRRSGWRATASRTQPARDPDGLFDASRYFDLHRLPELFCGFTAPRRRGPDALPGGLLAAGVGGGRGVHAAAGLPRAGHRRPSSPAFRIANAKLPPFLDHLELENIAIGDARLDVRFQRARGWRGGRRPRAPRVGIGRQPAVTAQVGAGRRRGAWHRRADVALLVLALVLPLLTTVVLVVPVVVPAIVNERLDVPIITAATLISGRLRRSTGPAVAWRAIRRSFPRLGVRGPGRPERPHPRWPGSGPIRPSACLGDPGQLPLSPGSGARPPSCSCGGVAALARRTSPAAVLLLLGPAAAVAVFILLAARPGSPADARHAETLDEIAADPAASLRPDRLRCWSWPRA